MPLKRLGPLVERINFGIVRVYLDDIQEIFLILKELTQDVRIQADDFVATEPQDLLDISSDTINELTIVATQPSVTVTLSANAATLGLKRKRQNEEQGFDWPCSFSLVRRT